MSYLIGWVRPEFRILMRKLLTIAWATRARAQLHGLPRFHLPFHLAASVPTVFENPHIPQNHFTSIDHDSFGRFPRAHHGTDRSWIRHLRLPSRCQWLPAASLRASTNILHSSGPPPFNACDEVGASRCDVGSASEAALKLFFPKSDKAANARLSDAA